jgi:hypothetical protein
MIHHSAFPPQSISGNGNFHHEALRRAGSASRFRFANRFKKGAGSPNTPPGAMRLPAVERK